MNWRGSRASCCVHANRNGFFYVLDRTNGEFLFGHASSSRTLTWATGLTPQGRPIVAPNQEPTLEGRRVCPTSKARRTGTRRRSIRRPGLYYVQTNEWCGIFTKTPAEWEAGKGFMGGSFRPAADDPAKRVLRAIDVQTGRIAWEIPQTGGRQFLGRHAEHGRRRGVLRRRERGADGGRRGERPPALELSNESVLEGVADDLHLRQQAVRRRRRRLGHHRVRIA